ncbi:MAG: hypothetical protein KME42_25875 [Tildeniella nuda ZEHNDER 1965/U140]|jgi:hypothetical protein|nr:hypothetical protein [Tildeniella nuda ZEHNDER 1965/U140]
METSKILNDAVFASYSQKGGDILNHGAIAVKPLLSAPEFSLDLVTRF